ncbi:MAG: hypothetical protein WBC36_14730 [Desulfobacterales bacterium]|nr:hypothetical protein [Desulfobacterales bacterium]
MKLMMGIIFAILFSVVLCGCSSGMHGTFVDRTYVDQSKKQPGQVFILDK